MSEPKAEPKYLTVKEFATRAGISTQRIYKLYATGCATDCNEVRNNLATTLQQYFKVENKQKYISIEALKLFNQSDIDTECNGVRNELHNDLMQGAQPIAQLSKEQGTQEGAPVPEPLQAAIEALTEQLKEKDKQLQAAQEQQKELTEALKTAHEALTAAQEQQRALTEALTAAQALHAGTIKQQLIAESDTQTDTEPPELTPCKDWNQAAADDLTESKTKQSIIAKFKAIFKKENKST